MKNYKGLLQIISIVLIFFGGKCYAQDKPDNMVEKFFTPYNKEKAYRINTITEEMIKNVRKQGVWGNPKFDLFMSQVSMSQHVSFDIADDTRLKNMISQIINNINSAHTYKLFTSSEKNGGKVYVYTLTNEHKVITEVALVTMSLQTHRIGGASFMGDNINLETIKGFAGEDK